MILVIVMLALSTGILAWFFISTAKAINKFDSLDASIKNKLLLIEYYMVFARRFKRDELIKLSELPDDEIKSFNDIHDINQRIKNAIEKITNL